MGILKYISDKLYSNDELVLTDGDVDNVDYGIESESYEDYGFIIKYPDGTMIQTKEINGGDRWVFSQAFISAPCVTAVARNSSAAAGVDRIASVYNATQWGVDVHVGITTTGNASTVLACVTAIGRWK